VLGAFWTGKPWAFSSVIWIYVTALFLDFIAGEDGSEPSPSPLVLRLITWLWLPLQVMVLFTGLVAVKSSPHWQTLYVVSIGAGAISGMFGIPVAHELMHRRTLFERVLGEMQMMMFTYTHFCIEHIEGHHANVGLWHDPATARFGETLYQFLPRTVCIGLVDAWRLEARRLSGAGDRVIGVHNRMLRYLITAGALYLVVTMTFGWRGIVFLATQSVVGILIIESINYVEHYGLTRLAVEPVTELHSWNSSHRISNWLMFNVPRHSDHHSDADRPYPLLRHAGGKQRQLPAGYFAMFVLALFPPLWRRIMDPLVILEKE